MVRLTDRPAMTVAVYRGRKATDLCCKYRSSRTVQYAGPCIVTTLLITLRFGACACVIVYINTAPIEAMENCSEFLCNQSLHVLA